MTVFILATCRCADLWPYTTLFIRTIRVGFPTATIVISGNGLTEDQDKLMDSGAKSVGATYLPEGRTTHQDWIESLVKTQTEPFWICDTDIIFYDSVETWRSDQALHGYLIPEFYDEFTRCITRSRLHTSLLRIDPLKLNREFDKYRDGYHHSQFNPHSCVFSPLIVPLNGSKHFYDTCSMLYHAIGGAPFSDEQKDAYFHFHHGTFSDLVLPIISAGTKIGEIRNDILENPLKGKGMWRTQDAYFSDRQIDERGDSVMAEIEPMNAVEAAKWNEALCNGDASAMAFCNLWYTYCHSIDDILDTMRDGRPRMSKDELLSTFFNAAMLYNSAFFVANRNLLMPIVLDITANYAVSVGWEKSPATHLRAMANVFRTCGNRMYYMVALICGGEKHALDMIRKIHERDFLLQNDAMGRPL